MKNNINVESMIIFTEDMHEGDTKKKDLSFKYHIKRRELIESTLNNLESERLINHLTNIIKRG